MTSPERIAQLNALSAEFYASATTRERRVEIATLVRDWAEEEMPESRCLNCHHAGVDLPYDEALIEGHCYSPDGVRDYTHITRVCEYCFDRMLPEED